MGGRAAYVFFLRSGVSQIRERSEPAHIFVMDKCHRARLYTYINRMINNIALKISLLNLASVRRR